MLRSMSREHSCIHSSGLAYNLEEFLADVEAAGPSGLASLFVEVASLRAPREPTPDDDLSSDDESARRADRCTVEWPILSPPMGQRILLQTLQASLMAWPRSTLLMLVVAVLAMAPRFLLRV